LLQCDAPKSVAADMSANISRMILSSINQTCAQQMQVRQKDTATAWRTCHTISESTCTRTMLRIIRTEMS
jgi:hypothetical protein